VNEMWVIDGVTRTEENRSFRRNPCPIATSSTKNPTYRYLALDRASASRGRHI